MGHSLLPWVVGPRCGPSRVNPLPKASAQGWRGRTGFQNVTPATNAMLLYGLHSPVRTIALA